MLAWFSSPSCFVEADKYEVIMRDGDRRPVFVVGCPRSGTTLLYHMLLSSGGFAIYRAETHVFSVIVPRFGGLRTRRMRRKLMHHWLSSHLFERSGLDADYIRERVLSECRSGGDFLEIVMGSIARQQQVERWADCTPAHLLYMQKIKQALPQSLFIHIVRDGRDVALSLDKLGWIRPFPWDRERSLLVAGLYWDWMVKEGQRQGACIPRDYLEVRFEELVGCPQEVLDRVGDFIGHELDYERILEVGIGSVSSPNTSFGAGTSPADFNPVGRWKQQLDDKSLARFEGLLGDRLQALGYEAETPDSGRGSRLSAMRRLYQLHFSLKQRLRNAGPLGRWVSTALIDW